jgi:acyl carrier protein
VSDVQDRHDAVADVVFAISRRRAADSDRLVSSGLIDSLAVLRLISALEARLGVKIPTTQVQPEDFDTIPLILETLDRVARP